jgi:6-phosphofructokinase 1
VLNVSAHEAMSGEQPTERDLDFSIARLGVCRLVSPMTDVRFVRDEDRILYDVSVEGMRRWLGRGVEPPAMEEAGPRRELFFDPSTLACGIVTCGGVCPGLNDVIRSIVLNLHHHYGVRTVYGFRFGYEGLARRYHHEPLRLDPQAVSRIHEFGGSLLGSSRGPQEPAEMVATLKDLRVGILFAIGGDGTLRGARAIAEEALRQGVEIAIVGVPKTIDNDISFVQKTFGFETAVTEARRATHAAHAEAESARNGIGLVKLMGRHSGFIAAYTALADGHANFCLVPEVPFTLERFLDALSRRIDRRGHAVIVLAEGAGQDLLERPSERDASGNPKLGDIGACLRDAITGHFGRAGTDVALKYVDPGYAIRSVPVTAHDSAFCLLLGHNAVHAGMSGRTNMLVSFWNHRFTHVPISLAVSERKRIDPLGPLWSSVLESTGQPRDMR